MVRKTFEMELQEIKDEVLLLGSMVEQATLLSVKALRERDLELSARIQQEDSAINTKRFAIEAKVMVAIATQQPMAHDLRLLASVLEVITEIERMGDYAKGIALINLRMGEQPHVRVLPEIVRMGQLAAEMLHQALSAFTNEDMNAARSIPARDDEVDALYNQVYHELMDNIIAQPATLDHANWMLWAAHNLERLADRVTNICERTIFICTGEIHELKQTYDEYENGVK